MHSTTQQIHEAIANSIQGLTEQQFRQHPEGKWDTAAILEHLALAYGTTARGMHKCIAEGKPLATSPTFKQSCAQVIVLRLNFIPGGRPAPKHVVPTGTMSGMDARNLLFANLQKMDDAFAECEQRFGCKGNIADHPVLGAISLKDWRKFHVLHTLHHVKQIEALTKPSSAKAQAGSRV